MASFHHRRASGFERLGANGEAGRVIEAVRIRALVRKDEGERMKDEFKKCCIQISSFCLHPYT
jgi:hypothetical protein